MSTKKNQNNRKPNIEDKELLNKIDETIKKEEKAPIDMREELYVKDKIAKEKKQTIDSVIDATIQTEKEKTFEEKMDDVKSVEEIGGVLDDDDYMQEMAQKESRQNNMENAQSTEQSGPQMTSEEAVQVMKSQMKRRWKGKVMFVIILVLCIGLSYYKPLYPDQDFFSNFTYYIIFIGMLAPLILYIIINEFSKLLKRKSGIDIQKNHKESLLVKPENFQQKSQPKTQSMNPLLVSLLGKYYNMVNPMDENKEGEKTEENIEESSEKKEDGE